MPFELFNNYPYIFIHIPKTGGTLIKHHFEMQESCHRTAMDFSDALQSYRIPLAPNAKHCNTKEMMTEWMAPFTKIATQAHAEDKSLFWDVFKFSVVRNPWDRFCSIYYWHQKDFGGLGTFEQFVSTLNNQEGIFSPDSNTVLRLTQTQYLSTALDFTASMGTPSEQVLGINESGGSLTMRPVLGLYPIGTSELSMDHIMRYETMTAELNELEMALGRTPTRATLHLPRVRKSDNSKRDYKTNYQHVDEIYAVYKAYREDIIHFNYTFTGDKKCATTNECHVRYANET